jgi:serine/threonine protein kinase
VEVLADRYRRVRSLGSGAMGEVWLADDTLLGRPVAIKQLRTDPDGHLAQWDERIRREARLAAQLNHPNAVAIYDLLVVDEQPYVVMEYVPGDSLAQRIRMAGRLVPDHAARWIGQVAGALEAAHARGIVHRDVKPANILITPYNAAKLTDFGIARSAQDVSQTQSGMLVGTPAFLAPEVARGGDPSPASDMWSLGATLYSAVEGRPPFGSGVDNPLAVLARINSEPVPPASSAGWLTPLLVALLDRDPARRPTATQVHTTLTPAASDAELTQPGPTRRCSLPGLHTRRHCRRRHAHLAARGGWCPASWPRSSSWRAARSRPWCFRRRPRARGTRRGRRRRQARRRAARTSR